MTAVQVKTLHYFGGSNKQTTRLIVAGTYLKDGRVAFIDRKNAMLIITNTDDETVQEVDLIGPLFGQYQQSGYDASGTGASGIKPEGFYKEHLRSEDGMGYSPEEANKPHKYKKNEDVKPSYVNHGFNDDQLLITYTGKDFSLGVVYQLIFEKPKVILQQVVNVKVRDRTRSIVALDKEHLCATTQHQIVILNKSGDCIAMHNRSKRDRGGLLMADGNGRVFYGDGDEFVCCQWNGSNMSEIFRFKNSRMKFPRGSAIDKTGRIVVCCDSSHNIFRISSDGNQYEIIATDGRKSFGDVDLHPDGGRFITTFWEENEWPILFGMRA